jgi:Mn2+/Fe2+ NRAMP family transporter
MEQGADLLADILGPASRTAFAVAMLCAGQSSSLTGVLSSQCVPPSTAPRAVSRSSATIHIQMHLGDKRRHTQPALHVPH